MKLIKALLRDESGVSAIEYGLLASLIALVAIGGISAVGTQLSTTFNDIASRL